jgi:hypothetical protein
MNVLVWNVVDLKHCNIICNPFLYWKAIRFPQKFVSAEISAQLDEIQILHYLIIKFSQLNQLVDQCKMGCHYSGGPRGKIVDCNTPPSSDTAFTQ